MNKICYASCCCKEETFERLWSGDMKSAPAQCAQKYHRLFAEGLSGNGYSVELVSFISVPTKYRIEYCYGKKETDDKLIYWYLPVAKNKFVRHIQAVISSYKKSKDILENKADFSMGDILCISVSIGCLLASKKRGKPFYAIVTDLPDMFAGYRFSLEYYLEKWILKNADGYVFLTQLMNDKVNKKEKPYVVLEGQVDSKDQLLVGEKRNEKFVVLYAGSMAKQYGVDYLIDGFIDADIPDSELHLYGNGDYVDKIKKIETEFSNIKYYGEQVNRMVVEAEKRATVLVNPRPTYEEYTKYSFPSKNMEYMLSGTAVLTTSLPGMPAEYNDYVYLIKEENRLGISQMLKYLFGLGRGTLEQKGNAAREFVLSNKNNVTQAKKVIEMFFASREQEK